MPKGLLDLLRLQTANVVSGRAFLLCEGIGVRQQPRDRSCARAQIGIGGLPLVFEVLRQV